MRKTEARCWMHPWSYEAFLRTPKSEPIVRGGNKFHTQRNKLFKTQEASMRKDRDTHHLGNHCIHQETKSTEHSNSWNSMTSKRHNSIRVTFLFSEYFHHFLVSKSFHTEENYHAFQASGIIYKVEGDFTKVDLIVIQLIICLFVYLFRDGDLSL